MKSTIAVSNISRCQHHGAERLIGALLVMGSLLMLPERSADAQTFERIPEGFTEPWRKVEVASPESGVLQELCVIEGEKIEKGAIVGRLDSQVLEATLNEARARLNALGELNGARATLENKQYRLKQIEQLLKDEHASDRELLEAQLDVELARAKMQEVQDDMFAREMNSRKIEAQLERRVVRAPISGTVLHLPRQVGEAITASESQIATIVDLDRLRVRFFLPTSTALQLKPRDSIAVFLPDTRQSASALVDFVSPVTDSKSGTVRVEMLIDNQQGLFRSGVRCQLNSLPPSPR